MEIAGPHGQKQEGIGPAGSRTIANGIQPPLVPTSQHDPGFLQKLIAAQRERNSVWSSEDSSSSDDEADKTPTASEPLWIPSNQQNTRRGPARKPESSQLHEEGGADLTSRDFLDRRGAASKIPHGSEPSCETISAVPGAPVLQPTRAPPVKASKGPPTRGPAQEAARKRKEASQDMEARPAAY